MNISIHMTSAFDLLLCLDDVVPLIIMSEHHYDSVCRQAGYKGGFLYGWRNIVMAGDPKRSPVGELCPATWRQLDTVLKICEMLRPAHQSRLITLQQYERTNRLCALICTALNLARREQASFTAITLTDPSTEGHRDWTQNPGRM